MFKSMAIFQFSEKIDVKLQTDLVATRQSVHLHQLTLSIKNQLCEGEQLRGEGTFG